MIDLERVRQVAKQRVEIEKEKFRTDLAMLAEGIISEFELKTDRLKTKLIE